MRGRILSVQQWHVAVAPALLVAVPLVGLSLQGDERRRLYRSAHHYSANPVKSARSALRNVDAYLDAGNFRPIGRFFEGLQHGLVFEASELTGMAPHAILGAIRMTMVLVLALTCTRVVTALLASAGVYSPAPILALYPLALGAALVANGTSGPLAQFSFMFIGSVVFVLASALAVARDQDMKTRSLRWHEPVTLALLGAGAAMTYDIVYMAPAAALVYIGARAWASRMSFRDTLRTAALRRWTALSVGFLAVFIPVRTFIAQRCGQGSCYNGSDLSLSTDAFELVLSRSLTAAPIAGWSHNASLVRGSGLDVGLLDLFRTSLPALLMLGIVALAIRAASSVNGRGRCRATVGIGPRQSTSADPGCETPGDERDTASWHAWSRPAVALGLFGVVTVVLSALVASLSRWAQETRPPIGRAWRETLAGQVGWSFVILAAVMILLGLFRTPTGSRLIGVTLAACLGVGLTLTLLANSRLAIVDRHNPVSSISDQIAEATISVDATASGNALRCDLIDRYTELVSPNLWIAGPGLRADLDDLTDGRHGFPFCDPARVAEFDQ